MMMAGRSQHPLQVFYEQICSSLYTVCMRYDQHVHTAPFDGALVPEERHTVLAHLAVPLFSIRQGYIGGDGS